MKTLLVMIALALAADASAARCGRWLVSEGYRTIEVLERCGEPVYREGWVEAYFPHGPTRYVDEWTYEFGRNKFRRLLRFENGRLIDIETRKKPVLRFR